MPRFSRQIFSISGLKLKGISCVFMLSFSIASAGQTQAQSFSQALENIAEAEDVMGWAAGVVCRDETSVYHGGLRDLERNLPVNEDTYFRIASVSKLVTAIGALLLEEQGVIDLNADAGTYLDFDLRNPDWPEEPVTLAMLLNHKSSVQDGSTYSEFLQDTYGSNDPPPISSLLVPGESYFAANNWRMERPGTHFAYSNLNYGLAATVMEAASGKRFDRLMYEDILPVLGIPGSFNPADLEDINNLAVLYRKPGGVWTPQFDNWQGEEPPPTSLPLYLPGTNGLIFAPQGGLRTSADGLLQIALFLMNDGAFDGEQLISPERIAELTQPQWEWDGSNGDTYFDLYFAFSRGAHHTTNRPGKDIVVDGYPFFGHPGAAYGLISSLYVEKETETAVLFISNGVGNGLGFDERSSFYTIETDVFEAFENYIFDPCNEPVSLAPETETPVTAAIKKIYPNPFNNRAVVRWQQPESGAVSVELYDVTGRKVWGKLLHQQAGASSAAIEAEGLASGLYIVRVVTQGGSDSRPVSLVK